MVGFTLGYAIIGFIGMAIACVLLVWPIYAILRRAGFNGWLSLLYFIPLINLVMLWVCALSPWPALDEK
jgi:hypothetical protein